MSQKCRVAAALLVLYQVKKKKTITHLEFIIIYIMKVYVFQTSLFKFICAGIKNEHVVRNASFSNQIRAGVVFRSAVSNHVMKSIRKFAIALQAFFVCSISNFF